MYFRFYALIFRSRCLFLKSTVLAKIERLILAKIRSCFWCQRLLCRCLPSLPLPMAARGSAGSKELGLGVLLQQQMAVVEQQLVFEARLGRGGSKQTTSTFETSRCEGDLGRSLWCLAGKGSWDLGKRHGMLLAPCLWEGSRERGCGLGTGRHIGCNAPRSWAYGLGLFATGVVDSSSESSKGGSSCKVFVASSLCCNSSWTCCSAWKSSCCCCLDLSS